jgi:hypothetical protein
LFFVITQERSYQRQVLRKHIDGGKLSGIMTLASKALNFFGSGKSHSKHIGIYVYSLFDTFYHILAGVNTTDEELGATDLSIPDPPRNT